MGASRDPIRSFSDSSVSSDVADPHRLSPVAGRGGADRHLVGWSWAAGSRRLGVPSSTGSTARLPRPRDRRAPAGHWSIRWPTGSKITIFSALAYATADTPLYVLLCGLSLGGSLWSPAPCQGGGVRCGRTGGVDGSLEQVILSRRTCLRVRRADVVGDDRAHLDHGWAAFVLTWQRLHLEELKRTPQPATKRRVPEPSLSVARGRRARGHPGLLAAQGGLGRGGDAA